MNEIKSPDSGPGDIIMVADAENLKGNAPLFMPPRESFLALRGTVTRSQSVILGLLGVVSLFVMWEIAHHL
ncbi:MAG: hypothetical protein HOC63_12390, partial [Rhodospirillales bacterium]|nr:hypothetical protein [Rhodospirillales bacterium]MBT4039807.1 hypothetical protein [Rhodospirillales bacterium]MBT4627477.1 hypothetical protein [Rhodospirillales bacterium]MBT5350812.1 hypothetical protein [Rhodospirillales bacterium]MBT6825967.1 hypothetical protein [Rhodospirillales bacterium]